MAGSLKSLIVRIGADSTEITAALAKVGADATNVKKTIEQFGNTNIGAGTLNQSLERVAANMTLLTQSQQKLATQAENVARGISTIGGPAKLTSDQLDQMARSIQKGLDAFRALGQEAPADLQKVSAAVKEQQQILKSLENGPAPTGFGSIGTLLSSFTGGAFVGGAAAVGLALGSMTRDALSLADSLVKLSDRTGISTTALQRLGAIATPSGNSLDEIAVAVNRFQKNLESGDQAASAAIARIGLSVSQLKALSPDEQFIAIAKGIQSIQDPAQQTLVAMELFGRGGAAILPTLKAKVDELANSTVIMSTEAVKALDDFGDGLGRLRTNAVSVAGEILAKFFQVTGAIHDAAKAVHDAAAQVGPGAGPNRINVAAGQFGLGAIQPPTPKPLSSFPTTSEFNQPVGPVGEIFNLQGFLPSDVFGGKNGLVPGQSAQSAAAIASVTAALNAQRAVAAALGLSLEDYQQKLAAVNEKIAEAERDTGHLTDTQQKAILSYQALGLSNEDISIKLGISQIAIKKFSDGLDATLDSIKSNQTQTGELQKSIGSLAFGYNAAGVVAQGFTGVIRAQIGQLAIFGGTIAQIETQLQRAGQFSAAALLKQPGGVFTQAGTNQLQATQLDGIGLLPDVKPLNTALIKSATSAAKTIDDVFGDSFKKLPNLLADAFTGGGGFSGALKALGTTITNDLFGDKGAFSNVTKKLGDSISGLFGGGGLGDILGKSLSSFLPAVGALIGPAIDGIKKLFGAPSQEELQGRAAVAQFEDQLHATATATQKLEAGNESWKETVIQVRDAYIATGHSEAEAEVAVKQLWDSSRQGAAATAAAIQNINNVLDEQKQDQADLQTAIEKYGFTIDELGPALQKQKLSEQAAGLENDFRLLVSAGIDMTTVLTRMGSGFNDFIATARRTGTEVPSEMQPILQKMIDLGLLTDDNGNKITDLKDVGVTFSQTMTQGFDRVVEKLNQLLEGLGLIPKALDAIPKNTDINITPHLRDDGSLDALNLNPQQPIRFNEALSTGGFVQSFARGGRVLPFAYGDVNYLSTGGAGRVLPFLPRGTDTVPAMLTPGELVLNAAQQRNVADAIHRGADPAVVRPLVVQVMLDRRELARAEVDNINGDVEGIRRAVKRAAAG